MERVNHKEKLLQLVAEKKIRHTTKYIENATDEMLEKIYNYYFLTYFLTIINVDGKLVLSEFSIHNVVFTDEEPLCGSAVINRYYYYYFIIIIIIRESNWIEPMRIY